MVHEGNDSMSRIVVSDVQVLASERCRSGAPRKGGKPIKATVVTLAVTPAV
jgi:Flp pilus assembly protein CpaB